MEIKKLNFGKVKKSKCHVEVGVGVECLCGLSVCGLCVCSVCVCVWSVYVLRVCPSCVLCGGDVCVVCVCVFHIVKFELD